MKKATALFLALIMAFSALSFASAEETDFVVKNVPVLREGEQTGTMDLRFYAEAPHVPCMGIKAYMAFLMQVDLTVTEENGVWTLAHPNGSFLRADPAAGVITAPDWASFQNPPVPYQGRAVGVKDYSCAWSYYPELVFDDAPAAVIFNFAKYGIPLRADAEDVYLPLSLLSTMFCDIAINYVLYNGESVFIPSVDLNALTSLPAGYYESPRMRDLLTGKARREEDEIACSYGELCFILDYFFGHPGRAPLDAAVAEKGLDAALKDLGTEGEALIEGLRSPDMVDYLTALTLLFCGQMDDGHTFFTGITDLIGGSAPYPDIVMRLVMGAYSALAGFSGNSIAAMSALIRQTRDTFWGGDVYRECGSTAILRIDAFSPDAAGWEAYYAGTGDIPMDALGVTWTGLKRASENPAIKNVLFDLSANSGGSGDMLMAMLDLAVGDNVFRGYNVLTGQHEHAIIRTDKNLDGVFDEKDNEVKYHFNYAVLTTRSSFSCGNLFPFLMQENGAVIIGEPTGGGSCCVQTATLSGGAVFMMSSYMWALCTRDDVPLEDGCPVDLPVARTETYPGVAGDRLSTGDYSVYFDDAMLDSMINDWFAQRQEAPAV